MKDLPKVYTNINKEFNNFQKEAKISKESSNRVSLDNILKNNQYSFNHIYNIILNDNNIIKDSIIQKTNQRILTIDNGWILINDIKYIEEIKK